MRSTLFFIPHQLAGLPVFGVGWALLALVVGGGFWIAWSIFSKRPKDELFSALPVWLVAAALVVFVLPQIETRWPNGTVVGLPIRGYGVMVLLGMLSGIGITLRRGQRLGINSDLVIGLGFAMMVGGVVGARAFYVFQKWDTEFANLAFKDQLIAIVKLTEGGLVIYGGIIGGLIALMWYCWRHRQPMLAIADLVAPGFLLGLAFGRIGCLLNGCCFGGVCTASLPAIQFPQGSAPYVQQLESGRLLGIETIEQSAPGTIRAVVPDSLAATQLDAKPGESLDGIGVDLLLPAENEDPAQTPQVAARVSIDGRKQSLSPVVLPKYSLPVHPSQIYASINALLLCMLVWSIQPWPSRDGVAFCVAVGLYSISRFLLELIRSDESGQFGTSLTIAQWISLVGVATMSIFIVILMRTPPGRAWDWSK